MFTLKSVEAYDHHENKWTNLLDMIEARCNHAAVSMGNKMFVIGRAYTTCCEVFDSFSRKFTKLYSEIYPHSDDGYFMHLTLAIVLCYFKILQKNSQKQLFTYIMLIKKNGLNSSVILLKTCLNQVLFSTTQNCQ